ncbi:MAG TPA: Type 1 glutamine amidotransferase-like domain-containing protein [Candidatus Paceibacterota bacterium]
MKQLFLTSEVSLVAKDISKKIKTRSGNLKTAYITTPLEKGHEQDDLMWHEQNKETMKEVGFDIFEYTITSKNLQDLERDLSDVDVIYVEGGSLVHMLNQSRLSGFDNFIKKFTESGNPYIGTSTGSFIVAPDTEAGLSLENYIEDNFNTKGIGLVNFLVMPHWGTNDFKNHYKTMPETMYQTKTPMIILSDNQYVWVKDNSFEIIVV